MQSDSKPELSIHATQMAQLENSQLTVEGVIPKAGILSR